MEKYNEIYQLFYDMFGERITNKIYDNLHGATIYFPARLYSREYTQHIIEKNMNQLTVRELVHLTGYSERSVRRIMREMSGKKDNRF